MTTLLFKMSSGIVAHKPILFQEGMVIVSVISYFRDFGEIGSVYFGEKGRKD